MHLWWSWDKLHIPFAVKYVLVQAYLLWLNCLESLLRQCWIKKLWIKASWEVLNVLKCLCCVNKFLGIENNPISKLGILEVYCTDEDKWEKKKRGILGKVKEKSRKVFLRFTCIWHTYTLYIYMGVLHLYIA